MFTLLRLKIDSIKRLLSAPHYGGQRGCCFYYSLLTLEIELCFKGLFPIHLYGE
nr:MAG TPA: hypothetical protein [Caudoviricetes sp.]